MYSLSTQSTETSEQLFSGPAQIELQGEEALEIIEITNDYALYYVNHIANPPVLIKDYRREAVNAALIAYKTQSANEFPYIFSSKAKITVQKTATQIEVNLLETKKNPKHMLWIAVGIEEYIPVRDYCFWEIGHIDNNIFAVFSLFKL